MLKYQDDIDLNWQRKEEEGETGEISVRLFRNQRKDMFKTKSFLLGDLKFEYSIKENHNSLYK